LLEPRAAASPTRRIEAPELSVIFVCLGNICRSPLAQGVFETRVARRGLDHRVLAESAGTSPATTGSAADPRARLCALQHFGSIAAHRARQFTNMDFDAFDLILVMDEANLRDVLSLARSETDAARVRLLLDYVGGGEVPDPVRGDRRAFERSYELIDEACAAIVEEIGVQFDGM
jgi:protein-tyrosine phosphatase